MDGIGPDNWVVPGKWRYTGYWRHATLPRTPDPRKWRFAGPGRIGHSERTDETCPAPTIPKLQRRRRLPSTPRAAARRVAAILEFSRPPNPRFARLYNFYSRRVLPWIGGALSGSREAYRYLPESVGKFPTAPELAEDMRRATRGSGVSRVSSDGTFVSTKYSFTIRCPALGLCHDQNSD
jgi:hypothetical protein